MNVEAFGAVWFYYYMKWIGRAERRCSSKEGVIYSLFRTKCSQDRIKTLYKTQKIDTQMSREKYLVNIDNATNR